MSWGRLPHARARALVAVGIVLAASARAAAAPGADYPIRPVPFTAVEIKDGFWSPRLETNRSVTVRHDFDKCETTGRVANFAVAGGLAKGEFVGLFGFNDSDVYKVIEGASYSLRLRPDPGLESYVDEIIAKIAAAQEDDGYLYTAGTIPTLAQKPTCCVSRPRWSDIASGHELYNLGHLYEAAVAHHQATGKRTLLDVALKSADLLTRVFGPGRRLDPPGHQEVEIGLVKLYRATGEQKYLDQARFFLEQRGNAAGHKLYGAYSQDHVPVLQQTEAVGHAVRAGYMYSAMADVGALTGDEGYVRALGGLWDSVVSRKLYLTGGIGARREGEAFGDDYELPNRTAYAETCAAIANAMWNHRLFLLHGDAKYLDVLERIVYNGFLSGVSLDGERFFYPNPLASDGERSFNMGQKGRSAWFDCSCCPTNVVRFLPSIAGYVYAQRERDVFVNLFVAGRGELDLGGLKLGIRQETALPVGRAGPHRARAGAPHRARPARAGARLGAGPPVAERPVPLRGGGRRAVHPRRQRPARQAGDRPGLRRPPADVEGGRRDRALAAHARTPGAEPREGRGQRGAGGHRARAGRLLRGGRGQRRPRLQPRAARRRAARGPAPRRPAGRRHRRRRAGARSPGERGRPLGPHPRAGFPRRPVPRVGPPGRRRDGGLAPPPRPARLRGALTPRGTTEFCISLP